MTTPASTVNSPDFLSRATALVDRGFSVIPITPKGKSPIGPGATSHTREDGTILQWHDRWPTANVAICADENITILESDDAARLRGILAAEGIELPITLTGGASENRPHWFFKRTPACGDDCVTVPGLFEFRNRNQYVVGPGSIHPSGADYKFWNNAPIVEIPTAVLTALRDLADDYAGANGGRGEHIQPGAYAKLRHAYLRACDPEDLLKVDGLEIEEGERHYTLLSLAGLLHDGERSADDIAEILQRVQSEYFDEGKGDIELGNVVAYAVRGEPFNPEPRELPSFSVGPIVFATEAAMLEYQKQKRKGLFLSPRELRKQEQESGAREQLIEGLLPVRGVNVAVGDSNIGKSPAVVQAGVCVAAGLPFLGRATKQGKVVLLDFENAGLLSDMIDQTTRAVGADPNIVNDNLAIVDRDRIIDLDEIVKASADASLVIVDSFRFLTNGDEKNGNVVMPIIAKLSSEKNCWLLVHHIRKGETQQKDEPDHDTSLVKADSVIQWLERASGHRSIINQATNRWAMDDCGIKTDLLIRVSVKGRAEGAPIHLNRIFEEETPIGYEVATGAGLLTPAQQKYFAEVMGKTVKFADVVKVCAGNKSTASRLLASCKEYKLVRELEGKRYEFARSAEVPGW